MHKLSVEPIRGRWRENGPHQNSKEMSIGILAGYRNLGTQRLDGLQMWILGRLLVTAWSLDVIRIVEIVRVCQRSVPVVVGVGWCGMAPCAMVPCTVIIPVVWGGRSYRSRTVQQCIVADWEACCHRSRMSHVQCVANGKEEKMINVNGTNAHTHTRTLHTSAHCRRTMPTRHDGFELY